MPSQAQCAAPGSARRSSTSFKSEGHRRIDAGGPHIDWFCLTSGTHAICSPGDRQRDPRVDTDSILLGAAAATADVEDSQKIFFLLGLDNDAGQFRQAACRLRRGSAATCRAWCSYYGNPVLTYGNTVCTAGRRLRTCSGVLRPNPAACTRSRFPRRQSCEDQGVALCEAGGCPDGPRQ